MNYLNLAITVFLCWAVISVIALDITWTHFGFIMRVREMRDKGDLTPSGDPVLYPLCMLVLIRGVLCDVWVQMFVCTVVGLELPPIELRWYRINDSIKIPYIVITEWLTTSRLIRWNHEPGTGWWTVNVKKRFVGLGKIMLDKMDTDGQHIK